MRKLKQQIFTSAVSLMLCISMLLGTTFAWFTDSSTSSGNVITAGSLDVEMYYSDTLQNPNWQNADNKAVFNYQNWEPGYTDIKYIKVVNEGNLAFKWKLTVEAMGAMTNLAEVIELFYVNPVNEEINSLYGMTAEGWLSEVVKNRTATEGVILPEGKTEAGAASGETIIAVVLHMDEQADNRYQEMSFGDGFALNLVATQYTYENDSFNNSYDKDSQWPNNVIVNANSASSNVLTDNANRSTSDVVMTSRDGKIQASVPAGTLVENDASKLTLHVGEKTKSDANITLEESEASLSIDVHVDGVDEENEVVIEVYLKALLPKGLNVGNFRLYHVEDGVTVAMEPLANGATPVHNNFTYDPATGDTTLYLKSFSEIALVANEVNPWNGTIADGFAGGDGSVNNPYLIANADQLAYLNYVISNENEKYATKNYKLLSDINLGGAENAGNGIIFYPIGYTKVGNGVATLGADGAPEVLYLDEKYDDGEDGVADYAQNRINVTSGGDETTWYTYGGSFKGVFDGNGNTISNIYQNTWQMKGDYDGHYWNAAMGIFGYVNGGTVKNLTVDNFTSDGEYTPTGVIAAYAANSTFANISIKNCNPRVYNTGNGGIVGIGGNTSDTSAMKLTFLNITVDNSNKISALWGSWDVACGGLMGMFRGNGRVHFENCNVGAQIDVYNDVCGNYQYYWYRYAGMVIGSIRKHTTNAQGYTIPDTTGITAKNCTVNFGDWNDYYYCELVSNTIASYTHDYQFSRLTKITSLDEIKSGDAWTQSGNFLYNGECYHIVNTDGVLTRHMHKDAGEETVNGETVLVEDKQIVYLPFNQLFTGYGWGVKHIPIYDNQEENVFDGVAILNQENSVEKFEINVENGTTYTVGDVYSVSDCFKATTQAGGDTINENSVVVFVSPVGEGSTVKVKYTANASDWKNGTLVFSGSGEARVVITDYTYCKQTTLLINVSEEDGGSIELPWI